MLASLGFRLDLRSLQAAVNAERWQNNSRTVERSEDPRNFSKGFPP
jgi:hypothetical protein